MRSRVQMKSAWRLAIYVLLLFGMTALLLASIILRLRSSQNGPEFSSLYYYDGLPDDILAARNIFFVETNDALQGFSGKVQCALESAARWNPDSQVFIFIGTRSQIEDLPPHLKQIPNVALIKQDLGKYAKGTPVEQLWKSGVLSQGNYGLHQLSDVVRLLLLYHFGGTYLDSDVISKGKLPARLENFVFRQEPGLANNGVMHFRQPRHRFLELVLSDLSRAFRPDVWGSSGPALITSVLKSYCPGWEEASNAGDTLFRCPEDLFVLPSWRAYPLPWEEWRDYFNSSRLNYVKAKAKRSFAVHYWNSMPALAAKEEGSMPAPAIAMERDHPIYRVFAENCPATEETVLGPNLGHPY